MRKYIELGTLVACIALAIVLWRSGVVGTTDSVAQSRAGLSPYEMMSNSKGLPSQEIADYY